MSSILSDTIKNIRNITQSRTVEELLVSRALDRLFYCANDEREERTGLHASAILSSDGEFCLREQVLSTIFRRDEEEGHSSNLRSIFTTGELIHQKWQSLFVIGGLSKDEDIERRVLSKEFNLLLTPDARAVINNRKYVVEIKSARDEAYRSYKTKHPTGTPQLQLYMHFLSIPNGFVLVENKNTQEHKEFIVKYDSNAVVRPLERLYRVKDAIGTYNCTNDLPQPICATTACKRAQRCPYTGACFGTRRIKLNGGDKINEE